MNSVIDLVKAKLKGSFQCFRITRNSPELLIKLIAKTNIFESASHIGEPKCLEIKDCISLLIHTIILYLSCKGLNSPDYML